MDNIVSINKKRDEELSETLNGIWEDMTSNGDKKLKAYSNFKYDFLYSKLEIPNIVKLKEIKDVGYINGHRVNATYIDCYFYDSREQEIYKGKIARTKLGKSDGVKTCYVDLIDLFLNYCRKCSWHLNSYRCNSEYGKMSMMVDNLNIAIVKFLEAGLNKFNIEEVLEVGKIYKELGLM